jgi:hypothetical protein
MVTISLTESESSYIFVNHLRVDDISLTRVLRGSSTRALDGSLIAYIAGDKKEYSLSLSLTKAEADKLIAWELASTPLAFVATDHKGDKIADYTGVVSGVSMTYTQKTSIFTVTLTIKEI